MRFVYDLDLHILDLTSTVRQSSSLDTSSASDSSITQQIKLPKLSLPTFMVHFLGAVQARSARQSSAGEHSKAYLLLAGNQISQGISTDLPNKSYSQPI